VPVAVHIVAPQSLLSSAARSRLLGLLSDEVGRTTRLELSGAGGLGLDSMALEACNEQGSLACWVRATRSEDPEFVLALTMRAGTEGRVKAALLLIPTDQKMRERVRAGGADPEKLEEAIFADAIAIDREVRIDDPRSWREIARELSKKLHEKSPKGDVGTLVIQAPAPTLRVLLDGEDVGALDSSGHIELRRVASGGYQMGLRDPQGDLAHQPVPVEVVTATVTMVRAVIDAPSSSVPLIGGLGLTAVGAALTIYASFAPSNHAVCVEPCNGGFVTFGEGAGSSSGIMIAPLGYGLALAGIGWTASPLLLDDFDDATLIGLGLSLLVGATVYGVSALAAP